MGSVARISITADGPSRPLSRCRKRLESSFRVPRGGRIGELRSARRGRPIRWTLLDLVMRVQDGARSDNEAVATIARLLRRGQVVVRGTVAGGRTRR